MELKKDWKIFLGILGVFLGVLFWAGMYISFLNSDEWDKAQEVISQSDIIKKQVGEVSSISTYPFDFSYSFGGGAANLEIKVDIKGTIREETFRIKMKRDNLEWAILEIT